MYWTDSVASPKPLTFILSPSQGERRQIRTRFAARHASSEQDSSKVYVW